MLSPEELNRLREGPGGGRLVEIYERMQQIRSEIEAAEPDAQRRLAAETLVLAKDAIGLVEEHGMVGG